MYGGVVAVTATWLGIRRGVWTVGDFVLRGTTGLDKGE